jgi:hypothetical protein
MRDKNQIFAWSNAELNLIKTVFSDNEALLYSIRKHMLQFPLTPAERELVRQAMTSEIFKVIKKRLLPDLEGDAPLGQIMDIRNILAQDLKSRMQEDNLFLFSVAEILFDYLGQQLALLEKPDFDAEGEIELLSLRNFKGKQPEQRLIEIKAYLDIVAYVDAQLSHLKTMAGQKDETIEQQTARLSRNSSE